MKDDLVDRQQVRHRAGELSCRTAEREQAELRRVVAVTQTEFANRVRHPRGRHRDKRIGDFFDGEFGPAGQGDCLCNIGQRVARCLGVQRLVARGSKYLGKSLRQDATEHDIAIGQCRRPASPIAGRPRVGAGRIGPHLKAATNEMQDRASTRCDRVDVHHRGLNAHAVDFRLEASRQLTGKQADVRGRAAHVEPDQLTPAIRGAGSDHADHAARRAGQDRVDPAETSCVHQPAVALHE